MQLVDLTLPELDEFLATLTDTERRYYRVSASEVTQGALYLRGYYGGGTLMGIAGAYRRYIVAFMTLLIIKEEHWGKGLGTKMLGDTLQWMQEHHIPYDIFQYDTRNTGTARIHIKLGILNDVQFGGYWSYNVVPLRSWAKLLRYPLLGVVWCYHILRNRNRGDGGIH